MCACCYFYFVCEKLVSVTYYRTINVYWKKSAETLSYIRLWNVRIYVYFMYAIYVRRWTINRAVSWKLSVFSSFPKVIPFDCFSFVAHKRSSFQKFPISRSSAPLRPQNLPTIIEFRWSCSFFCLGYDWGENYFRIRRQNRVEKSFSQWFVPEHLGAVIQLIDDFPGVSMNHE